MSERRPLKGEEHRKKEEAAFIIPIAGALFLLPPLANLFNARSLLFGLPLEVLYLFFIWMLLIAGAVVVSAVMPRRLLRASERPAAAADAADEEKRP